MNYILVEFKLPRFLDKTRGSFAIDQPRLGLLENWGVFKNHIKNCYNIRIYDLDWVKIDGREV